jgi:hypothetical protein
MKNVATTFDESGTSIALRLTLEEKHELALANVAKSTRLAALSDLSPGEAALALTMKRSGIGADHEAQRDRGTEAEPESAGLRETARGSGGREGVGVIPLVSAPAAVGLILPEKSKVRNATHHAANGLCSGASIHDDAAHSRRHRGTARGHLSPRKHSAERLFAKIAENWPEAIAPASELS